MEAGGHEREADERDDEDSGEKRDQCHLHAGQHDRAAPSQIQSPLMFIH